ncbi:hypothetical protein DCCM_4376 [Desulfocucumis palustris]|uniref:Uncharacterized protein n=1 Tax=Desulfocucumis palustris TaxID=1898651 RepID=A0A2L2XHS6_9FIRM|nr:hypothetical protein DCCM_4376 [Desulfocucumis palustris]
MRLYVWEESIQGRYAIASHGQAMVVFIAIVMCPVFKGEIIAKLEFPGK